MNKLRKNLSYNVLYQILIVLLPLVTAPYLSRVFGAEGIGIYSYQYSIVYYFALFGMLGISNHGNRCISMVKDNQEKLNKTFSNIYCIQVFTLCFAIIFYSIYMILAKENKIIIYIDVIFLFSYLIDISWLFFGLEKFKLTVIRNMFIKFLTFVAIFIFVKNSNDLWLYTLIMSCGTFFSQFYLWLYVKKYVKIVKPSINDIKKHIKPILVLFIPVAAYSIYKVMDKIMLGIFVDKSEVGLYENSEKIVGIPISIITAFSTVMMPRISNMIANNQIEEVKKYNEISFRYFTIIICAMMFGLIGISQTLPVIYYGEEFFECSTLIIGLSISLIFTTWANIIRTQYLIPTQNDKPYVVSTILGAIINLVLNFIFIPFFGAIGAIIGTVCAEFTLFIVQSLFVRKEFPIFKLIIKNLYIFPIGIIMCVFVNLFGYYHQVSILNLVIQIIIGGIVYIILIIILLLVIKDKTFKESLKKFWRK